MSRVRAGWRLLRLCGHIGSGLWRSRRLHRLADDQRRAAIQLWHAGLLRILAVEVEERGSVADAQGLHLPNHISWLDIPLLGAYLSGAVFLSKDEVRRWPVVGSLASAAGTLFIRRGAAGEGTREALSDALRVGHRVVLFAEGTTTRGDGIRRFHGRLLQAAIDADRPVHPVLIRYRLDDGGVDYRPAYVGDDSLAGSLWRILQARRIRAELHWLPSVPVADLNRSELARAAEAQVRQALQSSVSPLPVDG